MDDPLRSDVKSALEIIRQSGHDLGALFDRREVELEKLPPPAGYYCGFIEGVALSLDLTVLELLDELGLDLAGR